MYLTAWSVSLFLEVSCGLSVFFMSP